MSAVQKEIEEEDKTKDFEAILERLYSKGSQEKIEKYVLMQTMRKKQGKKTAQKIDKFLNSTVIDSSFVVYGQVIRDYALKWSERKRLKLEQEQKFFS